MPQRTFTVEFYKADARDGDQELRLTDLLVDAHDQERMLLMDHHDPAILMRKLQVNEQGLVQGVVWKIRKEQLPTAGTVEGRERELQLREGEGLVGKNHFLLLPRQQILVFERNRDGLTSKQLSTFLTDVLHATTALNDIVQPDAIARMMRGQAELKKVVLTIAHPSNPALLRGTDLGRRTIDIHRASGGSSLHIRMGTDMRSNDPGQRRLGDGVKDFVRAFVEANAAKTAKVEIEDNQGKDFIDLISDRILSEQTFEYAGLEEFEQQTFRYLGTAFQEKRPTLRRYFGAVENDG